MRQRKTYLKALFKEQGIFAKRRLGQCFLVDHNLKGLIVDAAELTPEDVVFEVGAGTGQLTEIMAERAGRILSVEIDGALYRLAREHLKGANNVILLNGDVLKSKNRLHPDVLDALAEVTEGRGFKFVSNLPYYVALPVIQNLLESGLAWTRMILTVQKEFAEKMIAGPGDGEYGAFSVLFSAWAEARLLRVLPPSVFWPAPKVDSALVEVLPSPKFTEDSEYDRFRRVVKQAFTARRKKIANGLDAWLRRPDATASAVLTQIGIDPSLRPEKLGLQEFMVISGQARPPGRD